MTSAANPFPGLGPYQTEHAPLFYGRDKELDEILRRLAGTRLLAVIGVSGCGKSSLVRAGLIPVLEKGIAEELPPFWKILTLEPGLDPMGALSTQLGVPPEWRSATTSYGLVERARAMLEPDEAMLVLVDQFEDIFRFRAETLSRDGGNEAALFVNLLLNAAGQRDVPVYVLITMRTDFLGDCAQFRDLPEALNEGYYLVPRMTRLQQQQAIQGPLSRSGTQCDAVLVQRLLNDSADDPDQLPVLQHLLKGLWETWSARGGMGPLLMEDYRTIGGWEHALARDADGVCERFPAVYDGIRALFQWITDPGVGAKPVRRPRPFSECLEISGVSTDALRDVIVAFQERGFLRKTALQPGTFVDLPHESVMWHWPRLKHWMTEEADRAAQIRFISDSRQRSLLTGLSLETARRLRRQYEAQPKLVERYIPAREWPSIYEWIKRSEESETSQRVSAEARELAAWTALSLSEDPERSLILGTLAWGKQSAMVAGLEEFLHTALFRSRVRRSIPADQIVRSVAWSPEGKRLAYTDARGVVIRRILDASRLLHFRAHGGRVARVCWSPDGKKLATAGEDRLAAIWDAGTGTSLATLAGHEEPLSDVAWSPDGSMIATCCGAAVIRLWSCDGGSLRAIQGHSAPVTSISWSPDSKRLVSGSSDRSLRVWDAASGAELAVLTRHQGGVTSVSWSPDGKTLASGSLDMTVRLWDAASGQEQAAVSGDRSPVLVTAWKPDGKVLAFGHVSGATTLWDVDARATQFTLEAHRFAAHSVSWSPAGIKLATGGADRKVRIWTISRNEEWSLVMGHAEAAKGVAYSPDSARIASASLDGTVKLWDAGTSAQIAEYRAGVECSGVAWSAGGNMLALAGDSPEVHILSADPLQLAAALSGHSDVVLGIAWAPVGTLLASCGADRSAIIWDAAARHPICSFEGHSAGVRAVAWTRDGKTLATASVDGTAKIWDIATRSERLSLTAHNLPLQAVAFSPDGSRLATASQDGTAQIWNAATGKSVSSLNGHKGIVRDVIWSPDGRRLATAGDDKTTRVWEAATGRELFVLRNHESRVWSVAWSPDGHRLAAGEDNGAVQQFAASEHELLKLVRARITRTLTAEERLRFLHSRGL